MEHSQRCIERHAKIAKLREEFFNRWPDACVTCNATGVVIDSAEFWWQAWEYDPCPVCSQLDLCPRCKLQFSGEAAETFSEEKASCPMCGFNHGEDDGPLAEQDYCECYDAPY